MWTPPLRRLSLYRPKLAGTTFQKALGSLLDKSCRVEGLIPGLAGACTLRQGPVSSADMAVGVAAARLARADLASSTVMEMTALAGIMGRHYAIQEVSHRDVHGRMSHRAPSGGDESIRSCDVSAMRSHHRR